MRIRTKAVPDTINTILRAQNRLSLRGIRFEKTGVPAMDVGDLNPNGPATTLVPLVEDTLLITRLPNAQVEAFLARILTVAGGSVGYIVGEKKAIPALPVDFDFEGLTPRKFASLTAISNDSVLAGGAKEAAGIQNALLRGIDIVTNGAFLSADAATDTVPEGIAYGVTPLSATGDLAADILAMIEDLGPETDFASLVFIGHPATLAAIGSAQGPDGGLLHPNVGVTGGEILGIPALPSRAAARDGSPMTGTLYLVDGSAFTYGMDGVEISESENVTIELSDSPSGNGDAPAAQSQQMVSAFQNELTAIKLVLRAAWKRSRADSVSILEGV